MPAMARMTAIIVVAMRPFDFLVVAASATIGDDSALGADDEIGSLFDSIIVLYIVDYSYAFIIAHLLIDLSWINL